MDCGEADIAMRKKTERRLPAAEREALERAKFGPDHLLAHALEDRGRERAERVTFILRGNISRQAEAVGKYDRAGAYSGQTTDVADDRFCVERFISIKQVLERGTNPGRGGSGRDFPGRSGLGFRGGRKLWSFLRRLERRHFRGFGRRFFGRRDHRHLRGLRRSFLGRPDRRHFRGLGWSSLGQDYRYLRGLGRSFL